MCIREMEGFQTKTLKIIFIHITYVNKDYNRQGLVKPILCVCICIIYAHQYTNFN